MEESLVSISQKVENPEEKRLFDATQQRKFPCEVLLQEQIKPRVLYLEGICQNLTNEDYDLDQREPLQAKYLNLEECEKEFDIKDTKTIIKEVNNLLHELQFLSEINDKLTKKPEAFRDTIELYQRKERIKKKTIYSIQFDGPTLKSRSELKRMSNLSALIPKQGQEVLKLALNNEFFQNKYEAYLINVMGKDFKASLKNSFTTNLCVLKSSYLLRHHPVSKDLVSIYFKSFELYTHQKACSNKTSIELIRFGQNIHARQQQLIDISETTLNTNEKTDQASQLDKAKKIMKVYKDEQIKFNTSLQYFNKIYLGKVQALSASIQKSVDKINSQNAALHDALKAMEDSNIQQENWQKTKAKQKSRIEGNIKESRQSLKNEQELAEQTKKNEILTTNQPLQKLVQQYREKIKRLRNEQNEVKTKLKAECSASELKQQNIMKLSIQKIRETSAEVLNKMNSNPQINGFKAQFDRLSQEVRKNENSANNDDHRRQNASARVRKYHDELKEAEQRSRRSRRTMYRSVPYQHPVTKSCGLFGWFSQTVYETRYKTESYEEMDDCGYTPAKQAYQKVLAEHNTIDQQLKQRSNANAQELQNIINKKNSVQRSLQAAIQKNGNKFYQQVNSLKTKQQASINEMKTKINSLRTELKNKLEKQSTEFQNKVDSQNKNIDQTSKKIQGNIKTFTAVAEKKIQLAVKKYEDDMKKHIKEQEDLQKKDRVFVKQYQKKLAEIRDLIAKCQAPGVSQEELQIAAECLMFAFLSLKRLETELQERIATAQTTILALKSQIAQQGNMSLKGTLNLVNRMQDEQFKKHALWIAQMKQSYMITQAKQLDYKLNILAGESITDESKAEILQNEIDQYLSFDPKTKQINVKESEVLAIEPGLKQILEEM